MRRNTDGLRRMFSFKTAFPSHFPFQTISGGASPYSGLE
jgi:hypothetical protein